MFPHSSDIVQTQRTSFFYLTHIFYLQLNGVAPVWVLSWCFKWLDVEHLYICDQLNGLSPMWVLSCFFKSLDREHLYSEWAQLNIFTLEWPLSCCFNELGSAHLKSHWDGFSPVWILSCFLNTWSGGFVVTLGTPQWFINCVYSYMSLQISSVWALVVTLGAAEWFITCVVFFSYIIKWPSSLYL